MSNWISAKPRLTLPNGDYCRDICGQSATCQRLKTGDKCGDALRYDRLREYENEVKSVEYLEARGYIRENMELAERLAQLAEECAELAQAALKLRRVLDNKNPTASNLTVADVWGCLFEETADVRCALDVILTSEDYKAICDIEEFKMRRWAERLRALEPEEIDKNTAAAEKERYHET